jgi:hypothetical protein
LLAFCTSAAPPKAFCTRNAMFDWPEHTQTSPNCTSVIDVLAVVPALAVTVLPASAV